jgi:membrane associated rhomboid family serine protease
MAAPTSPGAGNETGTPTCYRHPDRETYVSCTRCGRPACPDCLRSAAVGQQCVDCVKAGNQSVRQPRGGFGGRIPGGAVVTWALIGVNVVCYVAELISIRVADNGALFGLAVASGQWYRLITNTFLHEPGISGFGPAHIIFNMWALAVVGPALEQMLGRARFLAVYLASALAGSVVFYVVAPPGATALGASGAIFGLFGAWFVVARRLRADSRQVVMLIAINLAISFVIPHIAWQAHVGGLVAGAALTAAFVYAPRDKAQLRMLIQVGAPALLALILIAAVVLRDHHLAAAAAVYDQITSAVRRF